MSIVVLILFILLLSLIIVGNKLSKVNNLCVWEILGVEAEDGIAKFFCLEIRDLDGCPPVTLPHLYGSGKVISADSYVHFLYRALLVGCV